MAKELNGKEFDKIQKKYETLRKLSRNMWLKTVRE